MKRAIQPLFCLLLVAGCASEPGNAGDPGGAGSGSAGALSSAGGSGGVDGPGEQGPPSRQTAGGCACPASRGVAAITLDCFCAEFPNRCPSYDENIAAAMPASGGFHACDSESTWRLMAKTGCGTLTISTAWSLSGGNWIYDAVTHELLGVRTYTDTAVGACMTAEYQGGLVDSCEQGSVCPLCETDEACVPACSIEARVKMGGPNTPTYESVAVLASNCGASSPRELRIGCERVTVVDQFGTYTFKSGTHELLRLAYPTNTECVGGWGEPATQCQGETVCSLCQGAANVCTPEQLAAN